MPSVELSAFVVDVPSDGMVTLQVGSKQLGTATANESFASAMSSTLGGRLATSFSGVRNVYVQLSRGKCLVILAVPASTILTSFDRIGSLVRARKDTTGVDVGTYDGWLTFAESSRLSADVTAASGQT